MQQIVIKELARGTWAIQTPPTVATFAGNSTYATSREAIEAARSQHRGAAFEVFATSEEVRAAESMGREAGDAGKRAGDNPFPPGDADLWDAWERGRLDGEWDH